MIDPFQTEAYLRLSNIAREMWDTTPGDVINAVRSGNLNDDFAKSFVRDAEATLPPDHPELNDSDPDDILGWRMIEGEPVPEKP